MPRGGWPRHFSSLVMLLLLYYSANSAATPVRVRHMEGITHGFLILPGLDGKTIAYGELDQVVGGKTGIVTTDTNFHFNDGSSFREITKFTQQSEFRLVTKLCRRVLLLPTRARPRSTRQPVT